MAAFPWVCFFLLSPFSLWIFPLFFPAARRKKQTIGRQWQFLFISRVSCWQTAVSLPRGNPRVALQHYKDAPKGVGRGVAFTSKGERRPCAALQLISVWCALLIACDRCWCCCRCTCCWMLDGMRAPFHLRPESGVKSQRKRSRRVLFTTS